MENSKKDALEWFEHLITVDDEKSRILFLLI